MEGTALHKRGTSAEEWEEAKAGRVAPILDGSGAEPLFFLHTQGGDKGTKVVAGERPQRMRSLKCTRSALRGCAIYIQEASLSESALRLLPRSRVRRIKPLVKPGDVTAQSTKNMSPMVGTLCQARSK